MPREWRSVARLTAWLSNSANADTRLRTDIAWAFVDRAPIDWTALLERVSDPGVRSSIEELRSLGANDCIVKGSISASELLSRIARQIAA